MIIWNFVKQHATLMVTMVAIGLMLLIINLATKAIAPSPSGAVAAAVKQAPQIAKMERVTITPEKIKALPHKAKAKLKLPEPVADNPSIYALGSSRVEPDFYPVTVTTTVDTETGEVQAYEKREPLPWLAIPQRGEVGVMYGFKPDGPVARLYARQSLLDVKALRLGAEANVDSDGDMFAGASLSYRW